LDKKEKKKKKKKDKKNSTSSKSNKYTNSTSSKSSKYTNSTKSGKYLSMDGKSSKSATTTNGTATASKSGKAKDYNSTNSTNAKGGAKSVKMNVMRSSSSMSMSMVVVYDDDDDESPTLAPTLLPTMMPTTTIKLAVEDDVEEEEEVVDDTIVNDDDDDTAPVVIPVPICPTPYDITKTSYIGGSKVEMTSHIFECHSLYVQYCNIGTWDDSLLLENENAEELWSNAWVHVGPCSLEEVVDDAEEDEVVVLPEEAEDEVVVLPEAVVTEVPTTMPTFSPTLLPTTGVDVVADAESASVVEEETPPICPTDYDTTKTDYIGGDLVTVDSSIFECHSLYVQYCNIAEWDDSLLVGNANAEEMWDNSWVFVGPCVFE
jgi:hypothetical protein